MEQAQSQQSGALYDLSYLLLNILCSHPSSPMPMRSPLTFSSLPYPRRGLTPAGLASLMLGISLTLMLGGSLTFMIGFMLLPWVVGLVMLFYFVAFVSFVSLLGRTLLCYAISSSSPPMNKYAPAWKF